VWREPLVWAAADTFDLVPGAALQLALYRERSPDRLDRGTNLLRLPGNVAADFRFQYGDNSFSRHRSEAERHGLTVETLRDPAFCFDVDTPEDYAAWAANTASPAGFASRIASPDP
jgi:2-phospho-L-lactate guanylyltransferase (CobY/MobA/RfbA family)